MPYYRAMRDILGRLLVFATFAGSAIAAPLAVHLHATLSSPQPVGVSIGLTPRVDNAVGLHSYRYSVSVNGGPFRVVRDFSQDKEFVWSPALYEHDAAIHLIARNNKTKELAEDEMRFRIVPRAAAKGPVVTPTAHPLVALFSAPPCPEGSQFRVAFQVAGEQTMTRTPDQPCGGTISSNVYVAGMRSATEYRLRSEVVTGGTTKSGSWLPYQTGILDGDFSPVSIAVPRSGGKPTTEPVLIFSAASVAAGRRPFAVDLEGRTVWYMRSADFLTRVIPGGKFLALAEGQNSVNAMRRMQVLRETDLAGNVIRETNIGRVAEQLELRGIHSDCQKGGKECVPGFHHEAIRLPNGHTLAIAGLERILPAGTQGSKEPVDVLGDIVVDLDEDFQVTGVWNSFEHCDLKRASLYDAKCKEGRGGGGCPPIFLAAEANGWTHSNSLNYIASSGDFLISMPEQNWVLKIDWKNGKGSGKILWRLGKDGDFTAKSDDPSPWFSFQHDAGFEPAGSNILTILDDGHVRFEHDKSAHNRGQAWRLDEEKLTATPLLNADLGVYAIAVGSAQTLKNGGYSFEAGFINPGSPYGRTVETDSEGKVVFAVDVEGIVVYRSYRVSDMYSAPIK